MKRDTDYGRWESPISAASVAEKSLRFDQIRVDGQDLYWVESRPDEGGRCALIKNGDDLLPGENIRSRIHEFGGGAYSIHNGHLIFCRSSDQNLYYYTENKAVPLTKETSCRFAEPLIDDKRQVVYTICEQHESDRVINFIARIDLDTKQLKPVAQGADFYASLLLAPDGNALVYMRWFHPHMPWEESELVWAELSEQGEITSEIVIAGGKSTSVALPKFDPQGRLIYLSDTSGFWNLYSLNGVICTDSGDYGEPMWALGQSRYDFVGDKLFAIRTVRGRDELGEVDGGFHSLNLPFTAISYLRAQGDHLIFIAASPQTLPGIYRYHIPTKTLTPLRLSQNLTLSSEWLSLPEEISFTSTDNEISYGFYYPPQNPNYCAPLKTLPPLIVRCHGGPSGHTAPALTLETLFWTSRGFGIVDVNYGGSTGFGRAYRERLNQKWGQLDVDDAIYAARHLVDLKRADPQKLFIRGGSAGGFTTLCTLIKTSMFKAATCRYGISDLKALDSHMHKFEAHYLDSLLGPDKEAIFYKRSPLNHADKIETPILFLQGIEDKVVPKEQTEMMVNALKKRGIVCQAIFFEGEYHGFRIGSTIKQAIENELSFYKQFLIQS